jgi:alkylhydroperoxidase family enzyme
MQNGASTEKVEAALGDYKKSPVFSAREKLALELCERMTYTNKRVTDGFFKRLKRHFTEEELVELAAIVALENFRSKFNPVFAVEAQGFCPLPSVKEVAAEEESPSGTGYTALMAR